jgi:nitrogen fixation/metabolism regulation signal transduction histidine kinase
MPLAIVALLITALVSSVLAHSITRPVRALQRTTRELAAGNLDARNKGRSGDRSR